MVSLELIITMTEAGVTVSREMLIAPVLIYVATKD